MEPTLSSNSKVVIIDIQKSYLISFFVDIQLYSPSNNLRNKIVVFNLLKDQDRKSGDLYIKRCVGVPSDTIIYSSEFFIVNSDYIIQNAEFDVILSSSTNNNNPFDGCEIKRIILKNDQYFLLGDNYKVSKDSRDFGPISLENIIGFNAFN